MENNNQNNVNNTEKKGLKVRFAEFKATHPKTCKLVKRLALATVVAGAFVAGTKSTGSTGSYNDDSSDTSEPTTDETTTE